MARPRKPVVTPSASVRSRLMGLGGQRADGSPDVSRIASRLGRSAGTVRRYLREDRLPEKAVSRVEQLERADARKPKWIQVKDEGPTSRALIGSKVSQLPATQDVRGSLLSAFARKDGSIDTRRAADELGVSQRTVQRWAKGATRPRLEHQEALRSSVRESILDGKRSSRMANQGSTVEMTAVVSISGDTRHRTIGHGQVIHLSGSDMTAIAKAYARGGDKAADRELKRAVAKSYGSGFMNPSDIKSISEVNFKR